MNNLDSTNTIIIIITSYKCCELQYLRNCGYSQHEVNEGQWLYGMTDGSRFVKTNNGHGFSCILINPGKYDTSDVSCICKSINTLDKKIIIWAHNTDGANARKVITNIQLPVEVTAWFAHKSPLHNSEVEVFLKNISELDAAYESCFNALVVESLKKKSKEHLISLSILCQGYLAAHGDVKHLNGWDKVWDILPEDFKDKSNLYQLTFNKRKATKEKTWWDAAYGESGSFEDTVIFKELDARNADKAPFKVLFDAIQGASIDNSCVIRAFESLKTVLV